MTGPDASGSERASPDPADTPETRATDAQLTDAPAKSSEVADTQPPGRPIVERIGMAAIALLLAALFAGVALAAFSGGELFLGVMGIVGCLMTLWVGGLTLFRG